MTFIINNGKDFVDLQTIYFVYDLFVYFVISLCVLFSDSIIPFG